MQRNYYTQIKHIIQTMKWNKDKFIQSFTNESDFDIE